VRGVLVLPWRIPNVVVALRWLWSLDPQLGIVNQLLGWFGIPRQPFLGSVQQALPVIASINIWRHVGSIIFDTSAITTEDGPVKATRAIYQVNALFQ